MTTIISLALVAAYFVAGVELGVDSQPPELSGQLATPGFVIPSLYRPDTGLAVGDGLFVEAGEFSVLFSEKELASNVEGFQSQHYGVSQDTGVIVNIYQPDVHDNWKPTESVIENWNSLWQMRGRYAKACMYETKDSLTNLYRYYVYCDGDTGTRSHFFLMDRIPNPTVPRPATQDYIKGTCRLSKNGVRPDLGEYHNCLFVRKTDEGDQFTFRLQGQNVRLYAQVEEYIQTTIRGWRVKDSQGGVRNTVSVQ